MKRHVFVLTYNEAKLWLHNYPDSYVEEHFKANGFHFVILDNGNQPEMRDWAKRHEFTYYGSEHNIGSSGGYNWIFKVAYGMGLSSAILMQADVELSNTDPLLVTYNLTQSFGDRSFFIWPQQVYNYHLPEGPYEPWLGQRLHNLGNIVGFNPQALHRLNYYFDENYVVTHFDDVEYLLFLDNNSGMTYTNVAGLLNLNRQYYITGSTEYPVPTPSTFVIETPTYTVKIHHSSIFIDREDRGLANSHHPWYVFNKPIYDKFIEDGCRRQAYNPKRWTKFGYPEYPVLHEIGRFFDQNPDLVKVDNKLWEIPNKPI